MTINKLKAKKIGGFYNQDTRWGIFDVNCVVPTLTASMGMGGGFVPMIIVKNKKNEYIAIGTLAIHNSDKFGCGFIKNYCKTLRASKFDIGVVYEKK
jgi:hypothetical protein